MDGIYIEPLQKFVINSDRLVIFVIFGPVMTIANHYYKYMLVIII